MIPHRSFSPPLLLACLVALLPFAGCARAPQPADLVLRNGKLVTMDPDRPLAQALAVRDDRIVAVGSDDEIARLVDAGTEVVNLDGRLAVPGFIEGHGHFAGLGMALTVIDLKPARSWDEIVELVAAAAAETPEGRWIYGRGWHQEKWDAPLAGSVGGFPLHDALSRVAPGHPVALEHASGHAGIVNRRMLELMGIDAATPDPAGGRILRDAGGRPTGVLIDEAFETIEDEYERQRALEDEEELRRRLELANRECLRKGVTSFHDAGSKQFEVDAMREMAEAGELGVRLWVMLHGEEFEDLDAAAAAYGSPGTGNDFMTVRAIKMVADGALGSRSAWLLEPYSDELETAGLSTTPLDEIESAARVALDHDMQLCVHAIGDRANREILDLYERVWDGRPRPDLRWRIEHVQHLSPEDIPRFAEMGVIASMQGVHCTSDAGWVPQRLGQRRSAEGAYVWRDLLDSGAIVINGTDTAVEDVDPIANFYASVTRRLPDGSQFYPEQRMTRTEALKSYTIDAAYAAFEEQIKGSLTPGKLADIVVLSQDILTVPDDRIPEIAVLYTIVGGEIVHRADDVGGGG
jgi:predicted amidohydrolase YtcJ